jgi:hypothetical protein
MVLRKLRSKGFSLLVFAGFFIAISFIALISLPNLRGGNILNFLFSFFLASGAYIFAIFRLKYDRLSIKSIFIFAIIFRITLFFTTPSLSDDVYRYIWDGHIFNGGINPYAFHVNSPLLDNFATPFRALVNHDWMASPYLPTSQLIFAIVESIIPQSLLAFQITAAIFDLLTGWLILDILRVLGLRKQNILIYLWNPLVIIEFSHSAHVDALMIFLMMLAFWFLVKRNLFGSVIALATATLTKFLPILLVPIFWWRWDLKRRALFIAILLVALGLFIPGAGLGIFGASDGTGIFGALRIYLQSWNYNSGIYHWLEIWISGYPTVGAVPVEIVGKRPILIAKAIMTALLGLTGLLTAWLAWRTENSAEKISNERDLTQIRLATLPLGAYLLFAATIHPWYVTLIIPLLPFLLPKDSESPYIKLFLYPWVYFSIAVALSYLTYLDPENLRETAWVRALEYIPLYIFLGYAFLKTALKKSKKTTA